MINDRKTRLSNLQRALEQARNADTQSRAGPQTPVPPARASATEVQPNVVQPQRSADVSQHNDWQNGWADDLFLPEQPATPAPEVGAPPPAGTSSSRVTGANILEDAGLPPLDASGARAFTPEMVAQAHQELLDQGYVFVGFRGKGSGDAAVAEVNNGPSASRNTDASSDPAWSGLYASDDPRVAVGYTVGEDGMTTGQLLRVYLKREDAERVQNLSTPLDQEAAAKVEFEQAFGFALGSERPYALRGTEITGEPGTELILSPELTQNAVVIPSAVTLDRRNPGIFEDVHMSELERGLSVPHEGLPPPGIPPEHMSERVREILTERASLTLQEGRTAATRATAAYSDVQTKLRDGDLGGAVNALREADAARVRAQQSLHMLETTWDVSALHEFRAEIGVLSTSARTAYGTLLEQAQTALIQTRTDTLEAGARWNAVSEPDAAAYTDIAEHYEAARGAWSDTHQALGYLESAAQEEPSLLGPLAAEMVELRSGVNRVNEQYVAVIDRMVGEAEAAVASAAAEIEALNGEAPGPQNAERYGRAMEIVARAGDLQAELGRHGLAAPADVREQFTALETRLGEAITQTHERTSAVGVEFADYAMLRETSGANAATFENLFGYDYALRGGLRFAGGAALVLGVAADGYKLYKSDNKAETGSEIAGGWLGAAVAGGLASAAAGSALAALGPPGWLAELGVFAAGAVGGAFGYAMGARAGHAVYDVFQGDQDGDHSALPQDESMQSLLEFDDDTNLHHRSGAWYAKNGVPLPSIDELNSPLYQPWPKPPPPPREPPPPPFGVGG